MGMVSLFFIFVIFRQEWSSGLKTKKEIVLSKKIFGCFWLKNCQVYGQKMVKPKKEAFFWS